MKSVDSTRYFQQCVISEVVFASLDVTEEEAKKLIAKFEAAYPGVAELRRKLKEELEQAKANGYEVLYD